MRRPLWIALAVLVVSTASIAAGKLMFASSAAQPATPDPQAPPTMSPSTRARLFRPGTPWRQGTIPGQMAPAEAEAFSRYPLIYLGESIGGYHLTRVQELRVDRAPDAPSYLRRTDQVTFGYGDCVREPGWTSCPIPVSDVVRPV